MASQSGNRHSGTEVRTVGDRSGRDLAATTSTLERWLQQRMPAAGNLRVADLCWPQGAGMSNETLLFTAHWRDSGAARTAGLVVRIAPHVVQFFKDADLRQQFDLLHALHAGGHVQVAEPLWFEADERVLGQPFYVMRRLEGRVPVSFPPYNQSGFVFDATPAERARLWHGAMEELCRVALTPVAAVAGVLGRPRLGATGFEQHVNYWREARAWAAADTAPALLAAEDWFQRHRPARTLDGLCWGDARIGNMMFGADFRLTGVMDWEQASLGGPLFDLGWWLSFDQLHSTTMGLQRLAGLGTRQETLDAWRAGTGFDITDLSWYEAYAGYTLGVIVCRRYGQAGTERPGHNRNNNNYTRHMTELMGLAAPHDVILNPA